MKQPNGATIEELCNELHLNRRSIFRLIKIIEKELHKPFVTSRNSFGGVASYHLSQEYIEKISDIVLPELRLSFAQAAFIHLLLKGNSFMNDGVTSNEIEKLQKCFESLS